MVAVHAKSASAGPPCPAQPHARIIQRVTYKTVVYRPDAEDEQRRFFEEAQRDMGDNWAPGRSEKYIKEIGLSDEIISDAGGMREEEKKRWNDFDRAVNTDLGILVGIEAAVALQAEALERLVPQLKNSDKADDVNAALGSIKDAIQRVPEKWGIEKIAGFNRIDTIFKEYLKLLPWIAVPADLAELRRDPRKGGKVNAKNAAKNLAKQERVEKVRQDKLQTRTSEITPAIVELKTIATKLREKIRSSAADQYERGKRARVSARSPMNKKKLYLGEIATTSALRNIRDKGRGVLWASPWSPGVNTAFLEGGVAAGSVYKLKTPLPAQLKLHAQNGNGAGFKSAVRGKTSSDFWPFWNSLEDPQRFTIYTEELVYLMEKGYRLHEFRRKAGKGDQQIMVTAAQLDEVSASYSGR